MPGFAPMRSLALSLLCAVIAISAFGCSGTDSGTGGGNPGGALALELTIADGVEIDEVRWRISGDGMEDMTGVISTSAPGSTASIEVFGIPESQGNLIEMEATSTEGGISCQGSANFDVTEGEITQVQVMLRCKRPGMVGGVRVNGKLNFCAELNKVVVAPLQTSVSNRFELFAEAGDEEGDRIDYSWTSNTGTIADPSAATTVYTCTETGDDSITITVTDDGSEYCTDSWTVDVTCVPDEGDLCDGVVCEDDGNECTVETCNLGTGQCQASNAADGTSCNGEAGTCTAGSCVDIDRCADVTCEDLGECQNNVCNPSTGQCQASNVADGTLCNGGAGMCTSGSCVDIDRCADVTCEDLGECQDNTCNPNTGLCDAANVADGTLCAGGFGMCTSGACVDIDQCLGVTCIDLGECQNNVCNPDTGQCEASNVADGTSCDSGVGMCSAGTCIQAAAGLTVNKTGPPAVFTGQQFQFTVDVSNSGNEAATNVVLVDTLPASGSFISSDPAGLLEGNTLTVELGDLAVGETASVSVTWLAPALETTIVNSATVSADNASTASDDHAVEVGTQTTVTGGATAAGTGLRHRDSGTITITGVPNGATVTRAVLVWALLYRSPLPGNQITFEGQRISADLTQTISEDLCWGDTNTIGYAADVTGLVSGNGTYTVSEPVNAIIREDNDPMPTFPLTDGASLIVFYGGAGFNAQVVSDFSYSAESENNAQNVRTLAGINSLGGAATLILAGPDGQSNFGERVRITGSSMLHRDNTWDGSDPQSGPDFFLGNLWDTDVYDVSSIVPLGQTTLSVELGLGNDCTGLSAVVLEVAQ